MEAIEVKLVKECESRPQTGNAFLTKPAPQPKPVTPEPTKGLIFLGSNKYPTFTTFGWQYGNLLLTIYIENRVQGEANVLKNILQEAFDRTAAMF